jgi:hypothetical protein
MRAISSMLKLKRKAPPRAVNGPIKSIAKKTAII